jgi:hypothetical protein
VGAVPREALVAPAAGGRGGRRTAPSPRQLRAAQVRLPGVAYNRDQAGARPTTAPCSRPTTPRAGGGAGGGVRLARHVLGPRREGAGRRLARPRPCARGGGGGRGGAAVMQARWATQSEPPKDGEGAPVDRMGARVRGAAREALAASGGARVAEGVGGGGDRAAARDRRSTRRAVLLSMPAANVLTRSHRARPSSPCCGCRAWRWRCMPARADLVGGVRVAAEARARARPGERLALVSFAQGYVGYVETAEAVRQGTGEAKRCCSRPRLARVRGGPRPGARRDGRALSRSRQGSGVRCGRWNAPFAPWAPPWRAALPRRGSAGGRRSTVA